MMTTRFTVPTTPARARGTRARAVTRSGRAPPPLGARARRDAATITARASRERRGVDVERDVFDDRALVRAPPPDERYDGRRAGARERRRRGDSASPFGDFEMPRTPAEAARALVSPIGAFILAAIVSAANPTFMTSGREAILMKIYEREHPTTGAFVKDGVLYRVDRSGSVTANANDGLMVDKNGGIWIIVPQKDDATLIKEKYYMGQIEDVPTLPKNPSAAEQKQYDEYMNKLFDFDKLPNLRKVQDGPFPVPMRKETEKFFREGLPRDAMDEVEGAGALWGSRSEVPMP